MCFRSEENLYGDDEKVNHRQHSKSRSVYEKLFVYNECDSATLYPLLVAGAAKMREKLCTYAQNQLPGGKYWDTTDPDVKKVLADLKPSNDLCESILGLNDYLTTAIPNLHQMARSNLVEVKKNKTMQWLHDLPAEEQLKVIDLAVETRENVRKECKVEEEQRAREKKTKDGTSQYKKSSPKAKSTTGER